MNHPSRSNASVQTLLSNEEVVVATIQQIMKDFGMFGLEIQFSGSLDNAYEELMKQLDPPIKQLLSTNAKRLWPVLYQIDISTPELEKTAMLKPEFTPSEVIAHQVIERELKKVLTRFYYRSNTNGI